MATKTNRNIVNPYLRTLLADEVNALRKYCRQYNIDDDTKNILLTVAYNCHGRTDQHIRKFGLGILTGESEGAFPKKVPSSH